MSHDDTARTRGLYAAVADAYAAALPDTRAESDADLALIGRFVASLPPGDAPVLDAGCGTGRMLGYLAGRGVSTLTGVDLSPEMLAHAKLSHPDVPLAVADLRALPVADGAVRGILCWYAVIHTPDAGIPAIAAEFARVTAPGGAVLLAFQAGTGERTSPGAYGQDVTLHAVLHEPARVAEVFEHAGFDIVETVRRAPSGHGRHPQGFVLARRR